HPLSFFILASPLLAQFSVSDLAHLRNHESQRSSSYDRSGGNGDYRVLKSGATFTLFDENGPAEIRHIWITMATGEAYHLKKVVLRMYWDGEREPSVEASIGISTGCGSLHYPLTLRTFTRNTGNARRARDGTRETSIATISTKPAATGAGRTRAARG